MKTPFEVPAKALIDRAKDKLKEEKTIQPPAWMAYVKTGSHVERAPQQDDFWYIRCASLLRKLYIEGSFGVSKLRSDYGGRKSMGRQRERKRKAGGSIIRKALQQLEKAGFVEKKKTVGRVLTPKGRKFLDAVAKELPT